MKLTGRQAAGYFAQPDKSKAGLLIYGADPMRVAHRRKQVLAALLGPGADEEMRLIRLVGSDLRGNSTAVLDEAKATGFFPGPRAVLVEEAGETAVTAIGNALEDWAAGDAQIVVTAGALKPASKLRKLFEGHGDAYAAAIYDDPPDRSEIERMLSAAGLRDISRDSMTVLVTLARDLGPSEFQQIIEKVSLYKLDDTSPLSPDDIAACSSGSGEADLDDVLNVVAEARSAEIGPLVRRLQSQGTLPVTLCIGAMRHFKALYAAAAHPGGVSEGIARLRPPVFGPRRDKMLRQAEGWGAHRLETALRILTDTDLQLRSAGQTAPQMAVMERALIRLSMLSRRR